MSYEPLEPNDLQEALEATRDLARLTKAQFDGFVEAGFSPVQAMQLTMQWMDTSMSNNGN